jgi:hypothetical protein
MSKPGLDGRHGDKNGEISSKEQRQTDEQAAAFEMQIKDKYKF